MRAVSEPEKNAERERMRIRLTTAANNMGWSLDETIMVVTDRRVKLLVVDSVRVPIARDRI